MQYDFRFVSRREKAVEAARCCKLLNEIFYQSKSSSQTWCKVNGSDGDSTPTVVRASRLHHQPCGDLRAVKILLTGLYVLLYYVR